MIVAKQIADLITFTRLAIGIFMIWLGIAQGADALPLVIWLMLTDWVGDFLDGNLARRSSRKYHTWIGDHDLFVDMSVAAGLLIYLIAAHLINPWIGWVY
ncbi:MAG: CDP-alcohol phosphatidyltransferase family protein, partial [Anaerolineales bacterium]